jgi:hypothetical protein
VPNTQSSGHGEDGWADQRGGICFAREENQYFLISSIDFPFLSVMHFNIPHLVIFKKMVEENNLFESAIVY